MSTQLNIYVFAGVVLPYKEFRGGDEEYERLEPYMDNTFKGIEGKNGLTVLFDGMNGKYIAVGKALAKTKNYEGFDRPVEVYLQPWEEEKIRLQIVELMGNDAMKHMPPNGVRTLVISHYR